MFRAAAIYGVDFSGARLAGRTTWLARIEPSPGGEGDVDAVPYRLTMLARLESLAGTAERAAALGHLTGRIRASGPGALWALDFPFGFPVEVLGPREGAERWADQFRFLERFGEDGYAAGLECLRRARALGGAGHIRRATDAETRAPFDPYHYRIIYQTFFGMRDVLGPLRADFPETALLPFHADAPTAETRRVLVEACPSSTLKRLGLPHHNYKQPAAKAPDARRRATRRVILAGLSGHVRIGRRRRAILMRDPGGDALDAVIAAVGAAQAWSSAPETDPHPRHALEGRHYC